MNIVLKNLFTDNPFCDSVPTSYKTYNRLPALTLFGLCSFGFGQRNFCLRLVGTSASLFLYLVYKLEKRFRDNTEGVSKMKAIQIELNPTQYLDAVDICPSHMSLDDLFKDAIQIGLEEIANPPKEIGGAV